MFIREYYSKNSQYLKQWRLTDGFKLTMIIWSFDLLGGTLSSYRWWKLSSPRMWTRGGETWRQFQVLCEENTGLRLGCVSKVGAPGISGRTGFVGVLMAFVLLNIYNTNGTAWQPGIPSLKIVGFFNGVGFVWEFFWEEKNATPRGWRLRILQPINDCIVAETAECICNLMGPFDHDSVFPEDLNYFFPKQKHNSLPMIVNQVIQSGLFNHLFGGHLTFWKGHLTIPKRAQRCTNNCQ